MLKGIYFFLLSILTIASFATADCAHAAETISIRTTTVGKFKVSVLNEKESEGDSYILVGASSDDIKKYLPGGGYPSSTNAFLVQTPNSVILVDTGYGTKLFENMKALGVKPEDIDAVLLTHMHGDHIGGLLREGKTTFPKAKLYVAQKESDYWTSRENMKKAPAGRRSGFEKSIETLAAYKGRIERFTPGELTKNGTELLPGIRANAAYGHTPGHTAFMIESEGDQLLIWGDLTHAMAIQMPLPRVGVVYDVDLPMAIATREAYLDFIAKNKIPVAGMHIPMPGMGTLKRDSKTEDGYIFTPTTF